MIVFNQALDMDAALSYNKKSDVVLMRLGEIFMNDKTNMLEQLQRFYSLWKEGNAMYEEWAKERGLSSNSVLVLYSLYESAEACTQKSISQKWSIPKQTVNTILRDFANQGYIELLSTSEDRRSKPLRLTSEGTVFARDVIETLHERERYVIREMGLETVTKMNDDTELFINLFRNGGLYGNG